ncbi:sensor histidine kinase [Novosphingobium sp. SG720]|uniref:sensor histidine kinase n=1 Tax=Novosphingobium TaxID=165696 RepID=UPI0014452E05|nr:ATP-binding protein [Novosphingobium sp. SG720]NKJ40935.1 signal transduction histidine kinase [Novosphingobium sp. SG720]
MPAERTGIGRGSIRLRLSVGLGIICAFAVATLVFTLFWEYDITPGDLAGPDHSAAWREVRDHVILPILVLIVPTLIATTWVIDRALRPLARSARTIATTPAQRGLRLPHEELPVEVAPFVGSINDLLARLDSVAASHEAFAADVAHELRTPLAIMAMQLDSPDALDRAHLRREITAMHRLVDQLLLMAQIEAETATPQRAQGFSLTAVAEDVVATLAPQVIAQGREIALDEPAGHSPATVWGHREAVAAALRNLVENAVRVTPPGGLVRVAAGPGACLHVTDEGPGLAPEALASLTRRHARADHASRQGAGLGLNIVERIMAAHGGTLTSDAGRRTLTLRFPTPQSRGGHAS